MNVIVLAPFPNNPNPVHEFDVVHDFYLKGGGLVWYACPQLFFNVTLCSQGQQQHSQSDKGGVPGAFQLIWAHQSTPNSVMRRERVPMLYNTASNPRSPCQYICLAANVLGQGPHPLLHRLQHPSNYFLQIQGQQAPWYSVCRYPEGFYKVNLWLWRYGPDGRSEPLTISIEEAEAVRLERVSKARSRAEETKKHSREVTT